MVACDSAEDGSIETTPTPTLECQDESWEVVILQASFEDEAAQCLRTEPAERVDLFFCRDPSGDLTPSQRCIEDESGRRFWFWGARSLVLPAGQAFCDPDRALPRPCYTPCTEPTLGTPYLSSLCGEEETRIVGRCGENDSAFDESCCKRPFCVDGVCPVGMSCEWLANDLDVVIGESGECGLWDLNSSNEAPHCVPIR